ncbi:hypothetical protein HC823_00595 [Candidatus Gracilibacteria bacterium]|nr:hypothetical protein [Candidatus Gracilibacteria bacterium]
MNNKYGLYENILGGREVDRALEQAKKDGNMARGAKLLGMTVSAFKTLYEEEIGV